MLKTLFKFYKNNGIDFVFSDKELSYFKSKLNSENSENSDGGFYQSEEIIAPVVQISKEDINVRKMAEKKNFATQKNIKQAEKLSAESETLEQLKENIQKFDGCDLKILANKIVFGVGKSSNPDVMFIGDAPHNEEDKTGIPFVGVAGQFLDKMIACIGLNRNNSYMTNLCNWRPAGNRPLTEEEISICLPFIKRHIELISPKIIVFLGGCSAKSILGIPENINKLRGKFIPYKISEEKEIDSIAIFHPDFVLKNPNMKKIIWEDLQFIEAKIKTI